MRQQVIFWGVMLFMLIVFVLMGAKHGAVDNSWADTVRAFFMTGDNEDLEYFLWHLRMPKIVAAIAVGGALAVSGVILQNILNNPLASSFTLGLSQGASFGATFSIIMLGAGFSGGGFMLGNLGVVAFGAFLGALLSALIILLFSFVKGMTPQGLILVGVAMSAFFSACTMLMQYFSTDSELAAAGLLDIRRPEQRGMVRGCDSFLCTPCGARFCRSVQLGLQRSSVGRYARRGTWCGCQEDKGLFTGYDIFHGGVCNCLLRHHRFCGADCSSYGAYDVQTCEPRVSDTCFCCSGGSFSIGCGYSGAGDVFPFISACGRYNSLCGSSDVSFYTDEEVT